jgi:hypothetical protein
MDEVSALGTTVTSGEEEAGIQTPLYDSNKGRVQHQYRSNDNIEFVEAPTAIGSSLSTGGSGTRARPFNRKRWGQGTTDMDMSLDETGQKVP